MSAVFVSGLLIGCTAKNVAASGSFEMEYIESDLVNWVGDFYLYVDKQTDVEYIVYTTSEGVGITPRYNLDGTIYIREK